MLQKLMEWAEHIVQPWIDGFRLIEPIEYRFLTLDSLRTDIYDIWK